MLPRKLHLEQVNRFHDTFEKLTEDIDTRKDELKIVPSELGAAFDEELYELMGKYMEMIELWTKIDEFTEYDIKHVMDYTIKL